MSRTAKQAIAWAKSRKGSYGWDNLCLSFVRQAFGVYYNPDSDWHTQERNAGTAWDRAKKKHRTTNPLDIPAGVPVFFEMRTVADHVVLSTGNGRCLSNDFVVDGRIDEVSIAEIATHWGPLLGWTEDLVGNQVYNPPPPPKAAVETLTISHTSLQFGDTDREHTEDIEAILSRGRMLVGGTEAGLGAGNTAKELKRIGAAYDYRMWVPQAEGINTDCWVGVHKDLADGGFKTHFNPVIPSSREFEKKGLRCDRRWGPKGLVWLEFDSDLGHISHGAMHYLTGARHPHAVHGEVDHWAWNKKLGRHAGLWAAQQGRGPGLAFVSLDGNMADNKNDEPQGDMFFDSPVTTAADELEAWENTGHGAIDGIASYNHDGRVKALDWRVFTDRELRLAADHYHCEADYAVRLLK
jgi:hypothetical protein